MRTQMDLENENAAKKLLLQYKAHLCTQIQQHKSSFKYGAVGPFFTLIGQNGVCGPRHGRKNQSEDFYPTKFCVAGPVRIESKETQGKFVMLLHAIFSASL